MNTPDEFLIAYYLRGSDNGLRFPLLLDRLDKRTGKWRPAALHKITVNIGAGERNATTECLGSVVNLRRSAQWYYLDLHEGPSAGCLLVLSRDFRINGTLTGWSMAVFKSGPLVYEGNTVHFAPVQPETLFLYDPATRKSQRLYPPKNDPFRQAFSAKLKKAINRKACAENHWACDPNEFTTSVGPVAVNDRTQALAFPAEFDTGGVTTKPWSESTRRAVCHYVYIYRLHPPAWREFSPAELLAKFHTDSLKELLQPAIIRQVFAAPAAKRLR